MLVCFFKVEGKKKKPNMLPIENFLVGNNDISFKKKNTKKESEVLIKYIY